MAVQYFSKWPTIPRMENKAGITARIIGTKKVVRELNKRVIGMRAGGMSGLIALGVHIRNDMEVTPPLIPRDTGSLRASFKIIPKPENPLHPKVEIGWPDSHIPYTDPGTGKVTLRENYAAFVHEMTSPPYNKVNWSFPNSGPKFFEASIKRRQLDAAAVMAPFIKSGGGI